MINHLDNFGTNLTSATSASDTTSPLNSIPSVAAPFWVAFDATNLNGHYERKLITSKTATNVLHSALAYDHTTTEEVRMVNPSEEFDAIYQCPRGYLINGKLAVTDASGITVALKTLAGNDPSETDPVHVRIGDTVHTITSALSRVLADGTNWFNAGSAELATKEIDYFAYLVYDSNSSAVGLTFARIPYANLVSDFSATTTNEKYCAGYADFTTTDEVENIGRFAATLSAGAGYTWSVPTFTATNLIQRPIYETRNLTCATVYGGFSANPSHEISYKIKGSTCVFWFNSLSAGTSNATTCTMTLPIGGGGIGCPSTVYGMDNGAASFVTAFPSMTTNVLNFANLDNPSGWTNSGTKYMKGQIAYILN